MHEKTTLNQIKNTKTKWLFSFLILFFFTTLNAQVSAVEKIASYGYSKRFSDSSASKKIQRQALNLAKKKRILTMKLFVIRISRLRKGVYCI